jgi:hypothetical protein
MLYPLHVPARRSLAMLATLTLAAMLALGSLAPGVRAATENFTVQSMKVGGSSTLTLDGDQVSGFDAGLKPTACVSPATWQQDSDAVFDVSIPSSADVELSNGSFTYSGTATSAYYGSGSATKIYGGQFTITGQVNPAHTQVTATVTLSNAQDPFVTGCSGSYSFFAIPTVSAIHKTPDKAAYSSQFISFDAANGVVRNLQLQANFQCGPSDDAATIDAKAYGYPTLQTTANGRFKLKLYVLDEYKTIVSVTITGHVEGKTARGRYVVSEPPGGFIGPGGDACHGHYAWKAARPVPPAPPGPSAFFDWAAIRVPAGAAYRYYFAVNQLRCVDHATEVLVTVAHHTRVVPCSKSADFASLPLAPSASYAVTSQAVQVEHGKIVKRGTPVTVPLDMPSPNDLWTLVSGLPSNPPS